MKFKLFTLLTSLLLSASVYAQLNYKQLRFFHYGMQNGLPQNNIRVVEQDQKGYLWIGTNDGLAMFNGYEFEKFYYDPYLTNTVVGNNIMDIQKIGTDHLMITASIGISFYNIHDQKFQNLYVNYKGLGLISEAKYLPEQKEILMSSSRGTYLISPQDTLQDTLDFKWVRLNAKAAQQIEILNQKPTFKINKRLFKEDNLRLVPHENTQQYKYVKQLANQTILTVKGDDLVIYNQEMDQVIYQHYINKAVKINSVSFINNAYWVATQNGLAIINPNSKSESITWLKHSNFNDNGISSNEVTQVFQDSFGIIWIGTRKGLDKIDPNKQQFLWLRRSEVMNNPNLNNNCFSFFENENYFLSGYEDGILIFDKNKKLFKHLESSFGIKAIVEKNKGEFLLLSSAGLKELHIKDSVYHIQNTHNFFKALNDSLIGKEAYNMIAVNKNYLVGTDEALYLLNSNGKLISKSLSKVRGLTQDENGKIWFSSNPTKVFQFDIVQDSLQQLQQINLEELSQVPPLSILVKDDFLLLGLWGGGLLIKNLKTGENLHLSKRDGLSNNTVLGLLSVKNNEVWLSTSNGLSMFLMDEKSFINYTLKDGLQSMEFNHNAYYKYNNKLFFGGIDGFNIVNPTQRFENEIPPIVYINGVYWEGQNLMHSAHIEYDDDGQAYVEIPYNKSSLTFKVDGIHFGNPDENTFAYNFQGLSDEWISYKNKREFYFANISSGEYILKVKVANSDGIWSKDVKSLKIIVAPPFWLTWWFISIVILIVASIFGGYYLSKIALVKQQKLKLERMVKKRTREVEDQKEELEKQKALIEDEKNKEEKLLLNILPRETARELLNTGRAAPRSYSKATVMFADFKNFTRIAENLRPNELVQELDDSFAHFDDIVGLYNVEKIKTSGDAYMCVGGVPLRNNTNPVDCVLAALDFQRFMEQKRKLRKGTGKPQWHLRIGIHTGELIAGVVGKKKFLYDVWGDTVNIAARMETTSDPNKVNISGATYEQIKMYFDCEYRGKLPIKNKGSIDMYYVHRIKPSLSEEGKGIKPNKRFMELLKFNSYTEISYNRASKFLFNKLSKELPKNLYYHGVHHTKDVINAAERIGKAEGLEAEDLMLVKLAALLHDAGFLTKYMDNEPEGARMAREILPKYGFTDQQVEIIEGMILATKVPQNPQNHLEEILCDADLDYLGRSKEEFEEISANLCKELIEYGFLKSKEEWDPIQVKFLSAHQYYTQTAIKERRVAKLQRLEEIKKRLNKDA